MKRRVLMPLCLLLLLLTLFSGCGSKKPGALRICLDIGDNNDDFFGNSTLESVAQKLNSELDARLHEFFPELQGKVEFDIVPSADSQSTERSATLQRIRTEIMSGGGPDVFICACEGTEVSSLSSPRLFPYVRKSMEDGLFLPLDEFIKDAKYMDMDGLYPEIMAGGKNSKGEQVVMPLSFSVPMNIFHLADAPEKDYSGTAWDDVLSLKDPVLSELAVWPWQGFQISLDSTRSSMHQSGTPLLFTDLADFSSGKLSFTEDELVELMSRSIEGCRALTETSGTLRTAAVAMDILVAGQNFTQEFRLAAPDEELNMVAMPNISGGVTGVASMYCAVNSSTQNPEAAFLVIDMLLSNNFQKDGPLYECGYVGSGRMPVNMSLGTISSPFQKEMCLAPQPFEQWQKVCSQVTCLSFPSPLDKELRDMADEIQLFMGERADPDGTKPIGQKRLEFAQGDISDQELRDIVHKHYEKLEHLLDEA